VFAFLCVVGSYDAIADPTPDRFNIGRIAAAESVAAQDTTVFPDGEGLPAGRGTAREGEGVFARDCAACHGAHGEGLGSYPPLAGGGGSLNTTAPLFTIGSYWPYATTVWDYIRRAMPYDRPGALKTNEVYSVTAYVLFLNGIVKRQAVITNRSLPFVQMPNRHGFDPDPRPDVRWR
jgi:cytochrome c